MDDDARRPPSPPVPEVGPFRRSFWKSPLRGPWLASFLSSALLPLIVICSLTGFLSHAAYNPGLGDNALFDEGVDLYFFDWPAGPSWLYVLTQGLHIITGLAAIPILLAKLWAVIPQVFERPTVRSVAHALERLVLALLVGGSLFVFATGVLNIQIYYPFGFSFVPAHYYASFVFLAALAFHIVTKVGVMRAAFRERGVLRPLRDDLAHTEPEPGLEGRHTSAPAAAAPPTMTRRLLLGTVGVGSAALATMGTGQVVGGPLRKLALLSPRGENFGDGPNDFQVNKTAEAAGIPMDEVGSNWRLTLEAGGKRAAVLTRTDLLAMEQVTADLPIACVEGWSTTQTWTGVRLSELARVARAAEGAELQVVSVQASGPLRQATLTGDQVAAENSLLALKVNGADLSLDHGFPARVIVPALPGVHNTKWVRTMVFAEAENSASLPNPSRAEAKDSA
ncbi:MAG: molybdopterin-dependent oxidoreductase [Thermoleophilaceae bacterium]